jgi:hypothetical protein
MGAGDAGKGGKRPAKANGTFRPVGDSERRFHGRPALLAAGFSVAEQQPLRDLRDAAAPGVSLVFVTAADTDATPQDLADLPDGNGAGKSSSLRRAVVLSGLTERLLHKVMTTYRASGLPRPLWAAVTRVSANWRIGDLLDELGRERDALRDATRKRDRTG